MPSPTQGPRGTGGTTASVSAEADGSAAHAHTTLEHFGRSDNATAARAIASRASGSAADAGQRQPVQLSQGVCGHSQSSAPGTALPPAPFDGGVRREEGESNAWLASLHTARVGRQAASSAPVPAAALDQPPPQQPRQLTQRVAAAPPTGDLLPATSCALVPPVAPRNQSSPPPPLPPQPTQLAVPPLPSGDRRQCAVCFKEPPGDPVYPQLGDGQPCDGHAKDGRHWHCKSCLVLHCARNSRTCTVCRRPIEQMMTDDGAERVPEPMRARADEEDDGVQCCLCGDSMHTQHDQLFICSHEGCNEAWHQRCARMADDEAAALLANEDRHVWCSQHAPVRSPSPSPHGAHMPAPPRSRARS